jgi:hypothetical protein
MPLDVILDPSRVRLEQASRGIRATDLDPDQRKLLLAIVDVQFSYHSEELAARERERFAKQPIEQLYFAWAGTAPAELPWYWRIESDSFAIEFVYPHGDVNHAHRIWRDFERDLGGDPLRAHLSKEKKRCLTPTPPTFLPALHARQAGVRAR